MPAQRRRHLCRGQRSDPRFERRVKRDRPPIVLELLQPQRERGILRALNLSPLEPSGFRRRHLVLGEAVLERPLDFVANAASTLPVLIGLVIAAMVHCARGIVPSATSPELTL